MAFIFTPSTVVWGVPDKTGEVNDDQNDDDQNDATAADILRTHLNNFCRFNSETLTSEKQESRMIDNPVLR